MALRSLGSAAPSGAVLGKDVWDVFRVGAVDSGVTERKRRREGALCSQMF